MPRRKHRAVTASRRSIAIFRRASMRSVSLFIFFSSSWSSSSSSSCSSFVVIFFQRKGAARRIFCRFSLAFGKINQRTFIFIFLVKKDVRNALYKAHRNTQRRQRIRKRRAPLLLRELLVYFLIYNIKEDKT